VAAPERGIDRDQEYEKEPGRAWDEEKRARPNERQRESAQAPERKDARKHGKEPESECDCDESEQVKENEQAQEREVEFERPAQDSPLG